MANNATLARQLRIELNDKEHIFEVIRKHWWQVARPIVTIVLFIGLTLALVIAVLGAIEFTLGTFFFLLALLLFYGALLAYLFSEWRSYWQSALVITNERVIDCQQLTLSARRMQVIDIHEIQSCSGELTPVWGLIFNFGELWINTVGNQPIIIKYIPAPEMVSDTLMHYHSQTAHGGKVEDPEEHQGSRTIIRSPITQTAQQLSQLEPDFEVEPTEEGGATLLMFHVPSEKLEAVTKNLPAQKEPDVRYLKKMDYYQIETIIPTNEVSQVVAKLKKQGAEDIVGERLDIVG